MKTAVKPSAGKCSDHFGKYRWLMDQERIPAGSQKSDGVRRSDRNGFEGQESSFPEHLDAVVALRPWRLSGGDDNRLVSLFDKAFRELFHDGLDTAEMRPVGLGCLDDPHWHFTEDSTGALDVQRPDLEFAKFIVVEIDEVLSLRRLGIDHLDGLKTGFAGQFHKIDPVV